jgi:hypothetical protein
MGQMHSKMHVYQIKCSIVRDYDIVYGGTQMCAINWNSKKQTSIVMSSTKVEYMVVSQATRQTIWLSSIFGSISVPQMFLLSYLSYFYQVIVI